MNEKLRSQKGFVAVTLITLLAIALVLVVYTSLLATFQGGEVVVGQVVGLVWYSPTNGTTEDWNDTLTVTSLSDPWYAKVNFTSAYEGEVRITWQLERKNGAWDNATAGEATTRTVITDPFTLTGVSGQTAYASTNGDQGTNEDWGTNNILAEGSYRIVVYVESET